jgi:hypothetical protein
MGHCCAPPHLLHGLACDCSMSRLFINPSKSRLLAMPWRSIPDPIKDGRQSETTITDVIDLTHDDDVIG